MKFRSDNTLASVEKLSDLFEPVEFCIIKVEAVCAK